MTTTHGSSPILAFYRGTAPDSSGRYLPEILAADDRWLERTHDYIQWLFPLQTRSAFNVRAPTLDDATITAFRSDDALRDALARAFRRMLAFYGFEEQRAGTFSIVPSANAAVQQQNWLTPGNHNFLRLTRILTSLQLLGLPNEARALFTALDAVYARRKDIIGATTYRYWREAVDGA